VVSQDWDWDNHFHWRRVNDSQSLIIIQWFIPADTPTGEYLIRYRGDAKGEDGSITPIEGVSRPFTVSPNAPDAPDSDETPNDVEFPHLEESNFVYTKEQMAKDWEENFMRIITTARDYYTKAEN